MQGHGNAQNALGYLYRRGVVLAGVLFGLASALTGIPVIGAVTAMGWQALALLGIGSLLIGAIVGGALA